MGQLLVSRSVVALADIDPMLRLARAQALKLLPRGAFTFHHAFFSAKDQPERYQL
jgi:hypothetical protein